MDPIITESKRRARVKEPNQPAWLTETAPRGGKAFECSVDVGKLANVRSREATPTSISSLAPQVLWLARRVHFHSGRLGSLNSFNLSFTGQIEVGHFTLARS